MTVPLSEAKLRLDELIAQLQPGEELVLTDAANRPVARVVGETQPSGLSRYREFPRLRHHAAVSVCVAVAGITAAAFALAGWNPWAGFGAGLLLSVIGVSAAFAVAYPEAD